MNTCIISIKNVSIFREKTGDLKNVVLHVYIRMNMLTEVIKWEDKN